MPAKAKRQSGRSAFMSSTWLERDLPKMIEFDGHMTGPFCAHCGGTIDMHDGERHCPTTVPLIYPRPCCGCHGSAARALSKEDVDVLHVLEAADDALGHDQRKWSINAGLTPGGIYVWLWTRQWDRYVSFLVAPYWKTAQEREDYLKALMEEVMRRVAEVD